MDTFIKWVYSFSISRNNLYFADILYTRNFTESNKEFESLDELDILIFDTIKKTIQQKNGFILLNEKPNKKLVWVELERQDYKKYYSDQNHIQTSINIYPLISTVDLLKGINSTYTINPININLDLYCLDDSKKAFENLGFIDTTYPTEKWESTFRTFQAKSDSLSSFHDYIISI